MTDFAPLLQPDRGEPAHALHLVDGNSFEAWRKSQPERIAAAIDAQRFTGQGQELEILPGERTDEWFAALGVANVDELSPWCLATAAERRLEEHTSELHSLMRKTYPVFCLKKQHPL